MPWDQNFRYDLHCVHTFWHLKLKTLDFSKFLKQYPYTLQTTACMHLTLCVKINHGHGQFLYLYHKPFLLSSVVLPGFFGGFEKKIKQNL